MLPVILVYVDAQSTVKHISPTHGKPGHVVTVVGDNFNGCAPTVTFGGSPVTVTQRSDQVAKFIVPDVSPDTYTVQVFCGVALIFFTMFTVT